MKIFRENAEFARDQIREYQTNKSSHKWATSWENLFMPYANNKGADQPAHSRCLISAFVVHCLVSIIPLVSISKISSLYLASVAAQAGLSLPWSETPKTGFLMTKQVNLQQAVRAYLLLFKDIFKLFHLVWFNDGTWLWALTAVLDLSTLVIALHL